MQLHLVQPVPAPELSWGTGCSSTQQTGRQGAQGCRPLSKQAGEGHWAAGWRGLNSAGRTQAGLRTSGCWVLGLGTSSFCPALGPDSGAPGAPGSGPRDFKTLYLGTASSLSLSPGGEGKGGCWKGGPPRAGWESPFGCGGLPAGEGGAAEPRRVLQGGLGARASPLDWQPQGF